MSQSVIFQQFDQQKTDALWDDVLSGKYETDVKKEWENLKQQLPALQAKIPQYSGEELDFMLYGKDPKLAEYDKAKANYEKVREQAFRYELKLVGLNEFKEKIQSEDKEVALGFVEVMDTHLMEDCGVTFSHYADEIWFYTEVLFKGVLGVDIHNFMPDGYEDLFVIPFNEWVKVFKQAEPGVMQGVKDAFTESDYSFDEFSRCMLGVKKVVKACLDTNTEMIVYYDTDSSDFQKQRAKVLYDKVMIKKKNFLK